MRLLGTYLWKEWRDHRAVLVGMVLAVPLLLAVMGFVLPRTALDVAAQRDGFAGFAALAAFALFVVSLAADLVPGEARRGHRALLERLPGGLGAAFRGKLLLFAAGGVGFAAYGWLAAAVLSRIMGGAWPSPRPDDSIWVVAIVALWMFAVSCSLPRGALSLPAVAALALLPAVPVVLLWMLYPSRGPMAYWRWESGALWALGAVVAAWAAFRRRGFLRAGRALLVVAAICALPYWAHAGYGAYRWHTKSAPILDAGFLGEGGRHAFFNRSRMLEYRDATPLPPVVVDLETGVAREIGGTFTQLSEAAGAWYAYKGTQQRFVRVSDFSPTGGSVGFLDTRTAEAATPTEGDLRTAQRLASPWRLGDGRRAWPLHGRLEVDAPGGGFEVLTEGGSSPCGLGLVHWNESAYFDLPRGRVIVRKGLRLRGERVWIRPGRWLTRRKDGFELFDPDTNTMGPAAGLELSDDVRVILDDGRVFVRRNGAPALVDPETGRTTLPDLPGELAEATVAEAVRAFNQPTRTPDGRRVVLLYLPPGGGTRDVYRCAFARVDRDGALAVTAVVQGFAELLGCVTDDEAIAVVNSESVLRLRFGSDEKKEIWRAH